MNAIDFAKNLQKLGERHENDEVSVFDTNWARVCKEAAAYILQLSGEAKEYKEACEEWATWYHKNEEALSQAEIHHVSKDLSVIDVEKAFYEEPPRMDLGGE